jgi:hypothetical protein
LAGADAFGISGRIPTFASLLGDQCQIHPTGLIPGAANDNVTFIAVCGPVIPALVLIEYARLEGDEV